MKNISKIIKKNYKKKLIACLNMYMQAYMHVCK